MRRFAAVFLLVGLCLPAQITSRGGSSSGIGVGATNAYTTCSGTTTSCAVDISSLNINSFNVVLAQCWTATAPVTITGYTTTGTNPITTATFTYASSSNVTCRVNSNGGAGPQGNPGTNGTNGTNGASAYLYIAYALDASGTGFSTTYDPSLSYIAAKSSTSPIASPAASDFTGLWRKFVGPQGPRGAVSCQPGFGDGTTAIPAGTYVQASCFNDTSSPWTITGVRCWTNNNGTSTLNVANGAGTSVITSAISCNSSWRTGTLSAATTVAAGDYLKFTFISDGTTNSAAFAVSLQ